jgi:glycosyltransferase involved in cell wall biosynthesis
VLISVVIPAYNEEKTVGNVLNVLRDIAAINEIIVVSDGSTDGTAAVSRKAGARVIELPQNMGKGAAIKKGFNETSGEIVLLFDADLIGLKPDHVIRLLKPVAGNAAGMTVGVFSSGRLPTYLAQKISPFLSGQRAVRREILENISDIEDAGYGVEIALTKFARKENIKVLKVELEDLTHVMKEEKLGLVEGFYERLKMYWQILRA